MTSKKITPILLLIYIIFTLIFTIVIRGIDVNEPKYELFWSYREWISGNNRIGRQIIGNILMFCPIGYLLAGIIHGRKSIIITALLGLSLSCIIEVIQLITMRGMFELDDIFNNTVGTVMGWFTYQIFYRRIGSYLGIVAVIGIAFMCLKNIDAESNYTNALCFQIDEVGEGTYTGFTFRVGRNTPENYELIMKSQGTKTVVPLDIISGLERDEIGDYFHYVYDYRFSGFTTTINELTNEYEFIVKLNPVLEIPTGVYISQNGIHYVPEADFHPPTNVSGDIKKIISDGILLVYRPDYHCWVYQFKGALYWIVDQDFNFEDDGTTLIQYHLHTTQTKNLPQERLDNKWYWDNLSGYFEDYEVFGDFGDYRVMKRELPTEYSITSITTGYYKNGEWIWKEYFRPYYDFLERK